MDVKHNIVFPTLISEFNLSKHQCEPLVIEKRNLKTILDIYNKSKFSLKVTFLLTSNSRIIKSTEW